MKDSPSPLSDLVADAGLKPQSVEQRIARRLEVLRDWLSEGVPAGHSIPRSLKAARVWEDAELGIMPIASPNEFTTTHHQHGGMVRDIAGLLTALKKQFERPAKTSSTRSSGADATFDRKAFDAQLVAVISQWHAERDQRLHEKRRADAAEARSVMLLEDNSQKDVIIADLQRQLAARDGLRVVD